jgi:hypothetical protein
MRHAHPAPAFAFAIALAVLVSTGVQPAHAQRTYKVKVDSVPQGATVYLEDRDAGPQGTTPKTFTLRKGSYTFILELDGYEALTKTVEIVRATALSFALVKKPEPASFTLEAAAGAEAAGAKVRINGKEVGQVPVTLSLEAGRYLVEVGKDGFSTFSQWVEVGKGEKRSLMISLQAKAPGTGSVLVSSNIVGAEVLVDGRRVDTAPALVEGLVVGSHALEVRAKGYLAENQTVAVEAGKTVKLTVLLKPDEQTVVASGGTLQILASHKDVEVFVDGQSRGKAPVKVEGLAEGSHVVEGRRAGFDSAEKTVAVKKGELQTIKLALKETAIPKHTGGVRVISPVPGAGVFLDGQLAGKTPLLKTQLDIGPHFVTVRREGYADFVQAVEVKPGEIAEVKAVLEKKPEGASDKGAAAAKKGEAERERDPYDTLGLSSYGAFLVPPSNFTGDASFGFPHIFEVRLTAGLLSKGFFAIHGGVEFRTYGAVTEIGLHSQFRLVNRNPFALAVLFTLGGGGGPSSRNTFYTNVGVVGSMWFKKLVTFSARAYFNFYTDRHCPDSQDPSELAVCSNPDASLGLTAPEMRKRFTGSRFLVSAILEVPLHRRFNLFALLEGAPFQGNRKAYYAPFASIMPDTDPGLYGRIGATFKY